LYQWFKSTPFADGATVALAKEAVRARSLGQRNGTDVLSVVLSQVDEIGHTYGAGSQEQLDNLLRLDQELGDFFAFLDQTVGKQRYLVALTADHGMMDIPECRHDIGLPGKRITGAQVEGLLNSVRGLITRTKGSREQISDAVVTALNRADFVEVALTLSRVSAVEDSTHPLVRLFRNSCRPDRVPRFPLFDNEMGTSPVGEAGVLVALREGTVVDLAPALHGSPYEYDRHVPLILMGLGVKPGLSNSPAFTIDVAPTLARLAGIRVPEGLDGRSLLP
jgi:arylsulfatase A-like enzyme